MHMIRIKKQFTALVLLLLTDIVDIIRLHAFERIEGRLWSGHGCFVLFGFGCVKEILQRQVGPMHHLRYIENYRTGLTRSASCRR